MGILGASFRTLPTTASAIPICQNHALPQGLYLLFLQVAMQPASRFIQASNNKCPLLEEPLSSQQNTPTPPIALQPLNPALFFFIKLM